LKLFDTLVQLIDKFEHSKRNVFPVLDENNNFLGVVLLDNIRKVMFQPEHYDKVRIEYQMTSSPYFLDLNDQLHDVMKKFEEYNT